MRGLDIDNPYRRWARTAGLATVASVLVALAPAALPVPAPTAWLGVGVAGATLAGIFWFSFALVGRGVEGQLEGFRRGEWLARWAIPVERYEAWEAARARKLARLPWLFAGMAALAGGTTTALIAADGATQHAAIAAGITAVAAVLAFLVTRALAGTGTEMPRGRAVDVVVGTRCAAVHQRVLAWRGFGLRFIDAGVDGDPPILRVRYAARTNHGEVEHAVEIPVAPAQVAEAAAAARAIADDATPR